MPGLMLGAAGVGWLLSPLLPGMLRSLGLQRTNFTGQPIGTGAGLLFWLLALPWLVLAPDRLTAAAAASAAGFGLLGAIDDRWGTAEFKGLRGHLGALRRGRVTTGALKALGGGAVAIGLAIWLRPTWEAVCLAPLIALCANLLNLLDLRPLRALKVFWAVALPLLLTGSPVLWQTFGLSLPYARLEARRQVMLGDTGANLLGGLVGVCAAAVLPWWAALSATGLLGAFHLWAERHSLTAWIERHGWARWVDQLGRDEPRLTG